MKILLTGAAGFIGTHVRGLLEAHGHDVLCVDSYEPQVHGNAVRADAYSVSEFLEMSFTIPEVDVVVHLAARVGVMQSQYEVSNYVQGNVAQTAALLDAYVVARRCRRFIVASSMSIYGEGSYWVSDATRSYQANGHIVRDIERGWDGFAHAATLSGEPNEAWNIAVGATFRPTTTPETKRAEPASVYALTKYDQERYTRIVGAAYGIETVALRFFNTYGEGQALANPYTGVLAQFACRVLNGKPPLVYEDGQQTRDFIHVSDVAWAVVASVETPLLDGVYNVCTGVSTSVGELAALWCTIARERGLAEVEPDILHTYRAGDVRHCVGDPLALERATRSDMQTGWRAEVELVDGLRRTADWILENHFHIDVPEDNSAQASEELRAHGLERGKV